MKIGKEIIPGNVFLAPMAGITDLAFRLMCKKHGADMVYTEMINAKAVCYEDKNTFEMLSVKHEEMPVAVQIFGNEPEYMARAAKILTDLGIFKLIDINMGCPAPKVIKNGDGSALMKNIKLASSVMESVKNATDLPVTVKFRKGWDDESVNAPEFALAMQASGADAITVHGRTRQQYYSGKADWEIIRQIKQMVDIPVIANGDIFSKEDAKAILEHTKADGIMVARGAQGNPFIFYQISAFLQDDKAEIKHPDAKERILAAMEHYNLTLAFKDEHKAVREMRKHLVWYLKGMKNCAKIKEEINKLEKPDMIFDRLCNYVEILT